MSLYEPTLLINSGTSPDTLKSASDKINDNFNDIAEAIDVSDTSIGLLADIPAAGNIGASYFATDAPATLYIDTGTEWKPALTFGSTNGTVENAGNKNQNNGYCGLDAGGKVATAQLPDTVLGAVQYKGTHDCSTTTYPVGPEAGDYYIASVQGTISSVLYRIGDWLVYNGVSWDKVENSAYVPDADASTKGRIQLAGDISGTAASPTVVGIHAGATALAIDTTITDGHFLKRSGNTIISAEAAGNNYATVTAGETLAQYDLIYIDTADSYKAKKAINNSVQLQSEVFGMVIASGGIADDASGQAIIMGTQTNVGWSWTPNQWLYLSDTAGGLTHTCPTINGQFAIPVAAAQTATTIYIQPMTGWVVSNQDNSIGFKSITFNETSGTVAIITPPINAVITQITTVVTSAASGSGATIEVGVSGDTNAVMDTSVVNLQSTGNHIIEPYYDVTGSPVEYIATITAGAQTFSGTLYFHYYIPNTATGTGGLVSASFTQASSSPVTIATLPDNAVVTKCFIVIDTAATSGTPTASIGTVGDADLLMDELDIDLMTLGSYAYEPFITTSGAIYLTLTGHGSSGVVGRAYVQYMVVQ